MQRRMSVIDDVASNNMIFTNEYDLLIKYWLYCTRIGSLMHVRDITVWLYTNTC